MTQAAALPRVVPTPVVSVRAWLPWATYAGVVLVFLLYVVGLEQGGASLSDGSWMHELLHDGRHFLGFPCH